MVRRRVDAAVLPRLEIAAANVLRFATPLRNWGHSSAMSMTAFSLSYDEVKAAPRSCSVRRVVGWAGPPSVTTIPAPPLRVPAVAELSV